MTEIELLQGISDRLDLLLGLMILYSFYLVFRILFNFFNGLFKFI